MEVLSPVLMIVGIIGLFIAVNIKNPAKSPEKCWRCGEDAEADDNGALWCTECFVAANYSDPKLMDVKPGQTILPPMVEYRSQDRYPVHAWDRVLRGADPYVMPAAPRPWYSVVKSGYDEYFKNKGL